MTKLGISAHDILGSPLSSNLGYIAKAGFESVFFLWYDGFGTAEAMKNAKDNGLTVECFHAPFVNYNSIWEEGGEGDLATEKIKKCIRVAAEYGVPYVVSHVVSDINAPLTSNLGLCRYGKAVIEAEKYGVKLAFENTEYTRHLALVLSTFDSPRFCYDTGHEHCFTPGIRHMGMFGDRLGFLHLHDNLGINKKTYRQSHDEDLHRIPFEGDIDWTRTMTEIKRSGFDGTLMLECDPGHNLGFYGDITACEYYKKCFEGAKRLAALYESL